MSPCIFCKLAAGEIPAAVIFEDEDILAFKDIHPQASTHLLIIPKKHLADLNSATAKDEALLGKLLLKVPEIAKIAGLDSYRILCNTGKDSGQEVFHLHFHLVGGEKLGKLICK